MDISNETDIKILLDFVNKPAEGNDNYSSQIASLQALTTMCESKETSEKLLNLGGLRLIKKLLNSTANFSVKESCVYLIACAADSSLTVQQSLCDKEFFNHIEKNLVKSNNIPFKTKEAYLYLIISLTKNHNAQILMTSGLFDELLRMFFSGTKLLHCGLKNNEDVVLWEIATKALTSFISQSSDFNQDHCSTIFRTAITILHESGVKCANIIIHVCKLLSATLHNNDDCRKIALEFKGLEVGILKLQGALVESNYNVKLVTTIFEFLLNILPEIESEYNHFANLGGLQLILKAIISDFLEPNKDNLLLLNAGILIIARCANTSKLVCNILATCDAAKHILNVMNKHNIQGRLNKICTQLLMLCVKHQANGLEKNANVEKNNCEEWDEISEDTSTVYSEVVVPQMTRSHKPHPLEPEVMQKSVLTVFEKLSEQITLLQKVVLKEKSLRERTEKKIDEILEVQSNAAFTPNCQNPSKFRHSKLMSSFEHSSHSNFHKPGNILTSTMLAPNNPNNVFSLPDEGLDGSNFPREEAECSNTSNHFYISGNSSKLNLSDDVIMINTRSKTKFTPKTACTIIDAIGKERDVMPNIDRNYEMGCGSGDNTMKLLQPRFQPDMISGSHRYTKTASPAYSSSKIFFADAEDDQEFFRTRMKMSAKRKSHNIQRNLTTERHKQYSGKYQQEIGGSSANNQDVRQTNSCMPSRSGVLQNARHHPTKRFESSGEPIIRKNGPIRKYLTQDEINAILIGIQLKKTWREILQSYDFHPHMTASELKYKYYIWKEGVSRKKSH